MSLFFEVLSVDSVEVMWSILADDLDRFKAFVDVWLLFIEVIAVSCIWAELVPLREVNDWSLWFFIREGFLFIEEGSVSRAAVKWLSIWNILVIFDMHFFFVDFLGSELVIVLCVCIKRYFFILIFDSWNYLLPHLRLLSRVVFLICRIDGVIRSVLCSF